MNRLLPALFLVLLFFGSSTCTSPTEPKDRTPTPTPTVTRTPTITPTAIPMAVLTGKVTVEGWTFGDLTNQVQIQVQGSGMQTWSGTTNSNGVYGPIYNIVPGPVRINAWMTTRGGWTTYTTTQTLKVGANNLDFVIPLIR
ncbi:MAG TPA: hypothetical protein PLB02_09215 [Thermoanaerobaculia bacterium]|nr:hypothetical protein [Thermoanaerobaculia bacterium]HQR67561.1 hypothetical protein [Thermoanaerobaculia bacterium]